ncbi:MAG: HPF/RaiA family ribosome-associated protein [Marinifilaceae bacterium]|jgi:ribosome-associated translation inhibitor RaiA|nr:HPF/RaiA family ribosome-associated protein [Marinifilaceae bacterium]
MSIRCQFEGITPREDLKEHIEEKFDKMYKQHSHISSAQVTLSVVNSPEKTNKEVKVLINSPIGGDGVFVQKSSESFEHAASLAFDAIRKKLE